MDNPDVFAPAEVGRHHFHRAQQGAGFPISLGAETISIGHEALHGNAGELPETVEVFDRGREAFEPASPQKRSQRGLDAGRFSEGIMAR